MRMSLGKILGGFKKDSNDRIVLTNMFWAFVIKGGALLVQVFTLPAYIRFFNNQTALGVWYTLLSIVSWIFNFDLGIGNGLRNKLVSSLVKEDRDQIQKDISSAYIAISTISVLLCCVCVIGSYAVDWNQVLNISVEALPKDRLQTAVIITLLGVFIQFILKTVSSILYALQHSSINNLLALITSTLQLLVVLLLPSVATGDNFVNMAVVHALCVNAPLLVTTVIVFTKEPLAGCMPRVKQFSKQTACEVLKIGGVFLWAQIMFMILTGTNEYLITYLTQPENVVTYQIYYKVFMQIGALCAFALTPMWSAVTKALHENNYVWMKKSYERLHKLVLGAVILELLVVACLQFVFNIWLTDNTIQVDYRYATIFALFGCVYIWQTVESTIVCGTGRMKLQIVSYTACVAVKLLACVIVVRATNEWIHIITINAIVMLAYCIIQTVQTERDFKSRYACQRGS